MPRDIDKFRGCLIGGAIGDALGYWVEFPSLDEIRGRYGPGGITEYDLEMGSGKGRISDDTQMTLFTANGILFAITRGALYGTYGIVEHYLSLAYLDWLSTQAPEAPHKLTVCWIYNVKALHARRAPGHTCLTALRMLADGGKDTGIKQSKGCGGVMRVAPIGLFFDDSGTSSIHACQSIDEIDRLGARAAQITHGHPLGYIPAAALVHIINRIVYRSMSVEQAVQDSHEQMKKLFGADGYMGDYTAIMQKAIELAHADADDVDCIGRLGAGWVAEEALAIAVYCAIKYQDDFEKAVVAAVNHDGDSDSTGAITGNILGAHLGYNKLPEKFIANLELRDVILELANDLHTLGTITLDTGREAGTEWLYKYVRHSFTL